MAASNHPKHILWNHPKCILSHPVVVNICWYVELMFLCSFVLSFFVLQSFVPLFDNQRLTSGPVDKITLVLDKFTLVWRRNIKEGQEADKEEPRQLSWLLRASKRKSNSPDLGQERGKKENGYDRNPVSVTAILEHPIPDMQGIYKHLQHLLSYLYFMQFHSKEAHTLIPDQVPWDTTTECTLNEG